MKNLFKKAITLILTVCMAVTAVSVSAITAVADDDIYVGVAGVDTLLDKSGAKKITSGEKYSGDSSKSEVTWYKFTPSKSGTFKFSYSTVGSNTNLYLFDSEGNTVERTNISVDSGYLEGSSKEHIYAHSEDGKFTATVSYKVKKATYYLAIAPGWQSLRVGGKFNIAVSFPSDSTSSAASTSTLSATTGDILYFSTTMEQGDTLKLAAVIKSGGTSAKYSSSDTSIVTVDKNGKIKAKKEGTAYVYVKSGTTVVAFKITVVGD